MIRLREVIEFCKAEALAGRLSPTEANDWRYFCREYSKTFHTPLHQVLMLSPEDVIMAIFEEQLEKKNPSISEDFEAIVEEIRRLEDPNYDANAEKEMDDFVAGVEAFEEERLASGAPIPRPKKKKAKYKEEGFGVLDPNDPTKGDKQPPKSGFVDLTKFSTDEES